MIISLFTIKFGYNSLFICSIVLNGFVGNKSLIEVCLPTIKSPCPSKICEGNTFLERFARTLARILQILVMGLMGVNSFTLLAFYFFGTRHTNVSTIERFKKPLSKKFLKTPPKSTVDLNYLGEKPWKNHPNPRTCFYYSQKPPS